MSEGKAKKNSWASWVVIALVLFALILYLLYSLLRKGEESSVNSIQERLIGNATTWATQINGELAHSEMCGEVIKGLMSSDNLELNDERIISLMKQMVDNSSFYKIIVCSAGEYAVDETGKTYDVAGYQEYFSEDDDVDSRYHFLKDDGMGYGNVVLAVYPVEIGKQYILFYYDLEEVSEKLHVSGFESSAYAVLFMKDGTILKRFGTFKDSDSTFVTGESFLTPIQNGTSKEDYNYFKTKMYNETGCSICSTYLEDSRTISCAPIGICDWYVGFGVRQYMVDELVAINFAELRSAVIKLLIVLSLFLVLVGILLVINTNRSKEKGRKLEDKADMDLLTELTNKTATERMIAEYIDEHPNGHGVLFILDIDNFKKVNDTMGHAFGDTLLKTLGKEIRTEFRVTDIVGRTGGDEFMIFLKDVGDDLIVEREANRITRFFHDFKAGGDYVKYSATASIGVAIYPYDGSSFKDLYVSADQALYRAKKRGKNQLVFYNEDKYGKQ